jgi:hypothetical protein
LVLRIKPEIRVAGPLIPLLTVSPDLGIQPTPYRIEQCFQRAIKGCLCGRAACRANLPHSAKKGLDDLLCRFWHNADPIWALEARLSRLAKPSESGWEAPIFPIYQRKLRGMQDFTVGTDPALMRIGQFAGHAAPILPDDWPTSAWT